VEQGFAVQLGELGAGAELLLKEFTEEEGLPAEGLGACIVWEEVREFVAENGDATGLEAHYRDAGLDLGLELIEDVEKEALSTLEHAEVVEGASAAKVGAGDEDAESSGFEDFDGGAGGLGKKVVVEGVGPEKNLWG